MREIYFPWSDTGLIEEEFNGSYHELFRALCNAPGYSLKSPIEWIVPSNFVWKKKSSYIALINGPCQRLGFRRDFIYKLYRENGAQKLELLYDIRDLDVGTILEIRYHPISTQVRYQLIFRKDFDDWRFVAYRTLVFTRWSAYIKDYTTTVAEPWKLVAG